MSRTLIHSIIWGLIGLIFSFYTLSGGFNINIVLIDLVVIYALAGIPWGWQTVSFLQPQMFIFLPIVGWGIYLFVKFLLSYFVGLVAMPIAIIRYFLLRKKNQ